MGLEDITKVIKKWHEARDWGLGTFVVGFWRPFLVLMGHPHYSPYKLYEYFCYLEGDNSQLIETCGKRYPTMCQRPKENCITIGSHHKSLDTHNQQKLCETTKNCMEEVENKKTCST